MKSSSSKTATALFLAALPAKRRGAERREVSPPEELSFSTLLVSAKPHQYDGDQMLEWGHKKRVGRHLLASRRKSSGLFIFFHKVQRLFKQVFVLGVARRVCARGEAFANVHRLA